MELEPRIERLLNRRLDGELTVDEELELNKALIRSPEARTWLEIQAKQGELVRTVLRSEIGVAQPAKVHVLSTEPVVEASAGRRFGWSGAWSGLLAACLLLTFSIWQPTVRRATAPRAGQPNMAGNLLLPAAAAVPGDEFRALPAHLALPQRAQQAVDRNFVGVYDEATQQYYVIELRNVRTQTVLVKGDM